MASRDLRLLPLLFNAGVNEAHEPSTFLPDDGVLTVCENYVPEPTGGLRARPRYFKGSTDGLPVDGGGAPVPRASRGIGLFTRTTDPVVAQMTQAWQISTSGGVVIAPVFTWATPTRKGSLLLLLVTGACSSFGSGSLVPTVTGWTARSAIPGSPGNSSFLGWYELPNAPSQAGDQSPLSLLVGGSGTRNIALTAWLVEIQNVAGAPFDKASALGAATATSISLSTTATAQDSELVIALDAGRRAASAVPFTFSTATADWTEYVEAGLVALSIEYQQGAIYVGTRRAVGTQAITIDSSVSVDHKGLLVTYKGWNAAAYTRTVERVLEAFDDGSAYDIWTHDRTPLDTGAWALLDSNVGSTLTPDAVAFTFGLNATYFTAPSFAGIRKYDGVSVTQVAGSPAGARCIAVWKNRVWAAAAGRLYWSEVGDGDTWVKTPTTGLGTGSTDGTGADDGEPIEDITPFGDVLAVGKRNSLWAITGDSPASFSAVRLSGGGAAPGRSLISTPYGLVAASRELVYLWDGSSGVQPFSSPIERSYGLTGTFLTCSYMDGTTYICDEGSGVVFAFDMLPATWRTETMTDPAEAPAVIYNFSGRQFYGPKAGVIASALNYRDFPAPARGMDFPGELAGSWAAETPELWLAGPAGRWTPQHLWLKIRQRGGADDESKLSIVATYGSLEHPEGVEQAAKLIQPRSTDGADVIFKEDLSIGDRAGISWAKFRLTLALGVDELAVVDIEEAVIGYVVDGDGL